MATTTTGSALTSRRRAREQRLAQARERRLRLDPDRVARDQRIDDATVDIEEAAEAVAAAEAAISAAQLRMVGAVERLIAEKLTLAQACQFTGLDRDVVRRLRQLKQNPCDASRRIELSGLAKSEERGQVR